MGNRRVFAKVLLFALGTVPLVAYVGRALAVPRVALPEWNGIKRLCVVTCPVCAESVSEPMSSETLKRVYHCPKCLTWLEPKPGDHCIYDSYGSVKCPPLQLLALLKLRGRLPN